MTTKAPPDPSGGALVSAQHVHSEGDAVIVNRRGRQHPASLGFATVLVPCGVTLSVMALAMTSGSAWYGAVTMAVFVIGTSPLFTLIGYAAHKAASAWKGRLATATGVVVLAAGLYTLNGGLTLIGSPLAAQNLGQAFGIGSRPLPMPPR